MLGKKLWENMNRYVRGLTPSDVKDELTFCSDICNTLQSR